MNLTNDTLIELVAMGVKDEFPILNNTRQILQKFLLWPKKGGSLNPILFTLSLIFCIPVYVASIYDITLSLRDKGKGCFKRIFKKINLFRIQENRPHQ